MQLADGGVDHNDTKDYSDSDYNYNYDYESDYDYYYNPNKREFVEQYFSFNSPF